MDRQRIVAVGLLTQTDVDRLGPAFDRLWPVDPAPCFSDLVAAIDEADRRLSGEMGRTTDSEPESAA